MNTRKRILKVFITIILIVFLLSTALMSLMYLAPKGGDKTNGSGDVVTQTGTEAKTIAKELPTTGQVETTGQKK